MGSSQSAREYRGEGEGTPNSQLATSPLAQGQGYNGRVPMTRAWVDDELKRMAGSLGRWLYLHEVILQRRVRVMSTPQLVLLGHRRPAPPPV